MDQPAGDPFADPPRKPRGFGLVRERPLFHLALLALTFVTMTLAGGAAFTESQGFLGKGHFSDGFAFSVPLALILGVHELGHYFMCRRYGLAATLPYFLPSPFLFPGFLVPYGTFGAVIQIKEPIRTKRALLDVGAAGPLLGFVTALPFLLYGVSRPHVASTPLTAETGLIDYPILVRWAQHWTHVGPYTSATVAEHPTFMAAWFGLLVTCLNLLPIGQLDGGHVLRAAAGKLQPRISWVVFGLCLVLGVAFSPVWLFLPVVMAVLVGVAHPPVDDDEAPLGFGRKLVALCCVAVFLMCFTLTPFRKPNARELSRSSTETSRVPR